MAYIDREPGEALTLVVDLNDQAAPVSNPITGEDVEVSLRRLSDDRWYDFVADAWDVVADYASLGAEHKQAMTDKLDGSYEYDFDQAAADGAAPRVYHAYYRVTSVGTFEDRKGEDVLTFAWPGAGANTVTVRVRDAAFLPAFAPIQGVTVLIRAAAGGVVIAQGITDAGGEALFGLDDGTYYAQATRLSGYTHTEVSFVVSGDTTTILTMSSFDPGSPASPSLRRVWMRNWDAEGNYVGGTPTFTCKLRVPARYTEGRVEQSPVRSTDAGDDSWCWVDLIPTADLTPVNANDTVEYEIEIHSTGERYSFPLATGASINIESLDLTPI
jgi:hypothetical protein